MPDKTILLMYDSWLQIDKAVAGLTPEKATSRYEGTSRIAWTVGHVTHMLDSWLNVKFQGLAPHPVISSEAFRTGAPGEAKDWQAILDGVGEVRAKAQTFLKANPHIDLDRRIPYDGSIEFLRPIGLSVRYAATRIAVHHYMHAGEIRTVRSLQGHAYAESSDWGRSLV